MMGGGGGDGDVGGCLESVSWSIQCDSAAPPPLLPEPTRDFLTTTTRTAGAWAAARLRGGWERARPWPTQEGLLHLLSCRPPPNPPPHPSFTVSPLLRQLRPAGETAGRCCQEERRVRVCVLSWWGVVRAAMTSLAE